MLHFVGGFLVGVLLHNLALRVRVRKQKESYQKRREFYDRVTSETQILFRKEVENAQTD